MIVRRVPMGRWFGEGEVVDTTTATTAQNAPLPNVDVRLTQGTAVKGLALWVTAGVVTHILIRWVDAWLDRRKGT